MKRLRIFAAACSFALGVLGCEKDRSAAAPKQSEEKSVPYRPRPLLEHLPPSEVSWLVEVNPARFVRAPGGRRILDALFEEGRISAFSALVGASPDEVQQVWIARYPLGFFYLLEARGAAESIERKFSARGLHSHTIERKSGVFVSESISGERVATLLRLGPDRVVWSENDPTLAKVALAFAERRSGKLPLGKDRSPLVELLPFDEDALVRAFFLGPFDAAQGPLALTLGLASAFEATAELLRVHLTFVGTFDESSELAFREDFANLAEAPIGKSLGLAARRGDPEGKCELARGERMLDRCRFSLELDLSRWLDEVAWVRAESLGELTRRFERPHPSVN